MPTHLLLEGEDIESVLARLREDHGPDAKIVQAELVRSGGFAGFFARRRYEVTVEVEDDDLDAAVSAQADLAAAGLATPEVAAATAAPLARPAPVAAEPESHLLTTDFRPVRPYVPSSPPASTYAVRDDELSGMHALLSAAEGQDQADFGGRALAPDARSAPLVAGDPVIPAQGWHRPVSTQGEAFSDVLGSLTHSLAEAPPVQGPAAFRSFGPQDIWAAAAAGDAPTDVPPADPTDAAARGGADGAPADLSDDATAAIALTCNRLAELGVPARLLAEVTDAEPVLALRDVTTALPAPQLPTWRPSATRGGALIVVVGPWQLARPAVHGLVHELGADPTAIFAVATTTGGDLPEGCSVRSHAAAVGLVQRARQDHDISILVIDSGPTRHSAARTAETIATLEPQSVLVVADATSDLRISLLALDALDQAGIGVESMALTKVDRAAKPAAALEIPVPVSWLDGRFATSGTWLGTLVDAFAESAAAERGRVGAHARTERDDDSRIRPC